MLITKIIIPSMLFKYRLYHPTTKLHFIYCCKRCISSQPVKNQIKDHYKTLGIQRNATTKDIKKAFYELSKKHHPDMNPTNKIEAAQKFQNLSEAYEILVSDEKRRLYDAMSAPPSIPQPPNFYRARAAAEQARRAKEWSDLDIDYKDFEHFQRLNRKKRVFHGSAGNTTDAFWAAHQGYSENYKDNRALEREMLERRLAAELEEINRRTAYPLPTFEQLNRQQEEKMRKEKRRATKILIGTMPIGTMILLLMIFSRMS